MTPEAIEHGAALLPAISAGKPFGSGNAEQDAATRGKHRPAGRLVQQAGREAKRDEGLQQLQLPDPQQCRPSPGRDTGRRSRSAC
jgi:hypothetical protein